MLRKLIGAAAIVVMSAGAARAQHTGPLPNSGFYGDDRFGISMWPPLTRAQTPEDVGREHDIEQQYQETLRTKIPDRKPSSNDPWRKIRPAPAASDRHRLQ
jgi:hypothetical protein